MHWEGPDGSGGEGGGRVDQEVEHMYIHGWFISMYDKTHYNKKNNNVYAENIMQNAGIDESQAGIKIARRNINSLRYADDTTLMAEIE